MQQVPEVLVWITKHERLDDVRHHDLQAVGDEEGQHSVRGRHVGGREVDEGQRQQHRHQKPDRRDEVQEELHKHTQQPC